MLGGLAMGETRIEGLLEGEDVLATARAMQALGATIEKDTQNIWRVQGRGVGGLDEAPDILDLGNAGTATRLLMGLVASQKMVTFMTGDASLRKRPMGRVMEPLMQMGAQFVSRNGFPPLAVLGSDRLIPIEYNLPVPSAQVKSAILLAGLNCRGITTVVEKEPTRDHTENMLRHFGAEIAVTQLKHGKKIALMGEPELKARDIVVPGDISSAAFPLVAALLVPDSDILIEHVGLNPCRTGLLQSLFEMGADMEILNKREEGGEETGDIHVRGSHLKGIEVPPDRAPSMIDEYPILAMAAACAEGQSRFTGLKELRVKESDRLSAIARGLGACDVDIEEGEDWLIVHGKGKPPRGKAAIEVELDHRVAMAFLILGMVSEQAIAIDDASSIGTSFPGFVEEMASLGANFDR